jgi:hypothetical protein
MTNEIDTIYYGQRDGMVAEVAAYDPTDRDDNSMWTKESTEFMMLPTGPGGQYDTEWYFTLAEARAAAVDVASNYPGSTICIV